MMDLFIVLPFNKQQILQSERKFEELVAGKSSDSRKDDLFPHIYGSINNAAVIKTIYFLRMKMAILLFHKS